MQIMQIIPRGRALNGMSDILSLLHYNQRGKWDDRIEDTMEDRLWAYCHIFTGLHDFPSATPRLAGGNW